VGRELAAQGLDEVEELLVDGCSRRHGPKLRDNPMSFER